MNGWRTLLPNAWYVAQREFRSRVRTRSFVVVTIVLAAIAVAVTMLPVVIDATIASSHTKLAVVARAPDLPTDGQTMLTGTLNQTAGGGAPFAVIWLAADQATQAQKDLEAGKYDALLTVDRTAGGDLAFTLRTDLPADGRSVGAIRAALPLLAVEDRLVRAGTSLAGVGNVDLDIKPVSLLASSSTNNTSQEISTSLLSTGLIVLIFMAIVYYGSWVSMSVAEEKGSRVMELMLNATTPLQMLTGKVVGNGAAGLTQYSVVLAAGIAGLVAQGPVRQRFLGETSSTSVFGGLTPTVFGAFVCLFVLGFLLYSLLYAGLGSLVSRQEDVQSATMPLTTMVFLGYFGSLTALQSIDETWVKVVSFIPFFSPYVMLARVSVGHVAPWEFGVAMILMVAAIAAALVVAARIYSAGVLLYGQRVGLRQILGAARVSR
jgi:ABC-2 type transport system permease protein